jgi:hypothetical protein
MSEKTKEHAEIVRKVEEVLEVLEEALITAQLLKEYVDDLSVQGVASIMGNVALGNTRVMKIVRMIATRARSSILRERKFKELEETRRKRLQDCSDSEGVLVV